MWSKSSSLMVLDDDLLITDLKSKWSKNQGHHCQSNCQKLQERTRGKHVGMYLHACEFSCRCVFSCVWIPAIHVNCVFLIDIRCLIDARCVRRCSFFVSLYLHEYTYIYACILAQWCSNNVTYPGSIPSCSCSIDPKSPSVQVAYATYSVASLQGFNRWGTWGGNRRTNRNDNH